MRTPRRLWLLLVGLLALTPWLGRAEGQVRDAASSHVPLPPPAGGQSADTEQLFKDRFGQSEGLATLRQLFGNNLDKLFRDLRDHKIDPKDLRKHLEDARQKAGPDRQPTAAEIEAARRLLENMMPKDARLPLPDPMRHPMPDPPPVAPSPAPSKVELPPVTPPTAPAPAAAADDWRARFSEWLLRQSQNQDWGKALDDSPALRELVRDLTHSLGEAGLAPSDGTADGWFGNALTSLGQRELPQFSAPSAEVNSPPRRESSSSGGPPSDGGQTLAWLLIGGVTALLVYKLLSRRLGLLGGKAEDWSLGPWPVRPEAVATREELVRSFDYLSLLLLGRQAQCWNHRQIAGRLGGLVAEKQRAALELAAVYEKARYAPSDEPLDDAALAAARRDLCYLAGVAGA